MIKRLLLTFALLIPAPAFADEVAPSSEPTPQSLFDIPVAAYTPPLEASQGVGGWAVVHPVTGVVHGVIVGTIETYNAWNGRMPSEYMGCPAGCLLRFQTRATADGNVAGWHGPEVTYDSSDQTFNLGYTSQSPEGSTTVKQKLIPEKTAADGINLSTGLVDIRTEFISTQVNGFVVKLTKIQQDFESQDQSVVEFQDWQSFTYQNSAEMNQNLEADVDSALIAQGFDTEVPVEDGFVDTVKKLTKKITGFFGGLFSSE